MTWFRKFLILTHRYLGIVLSLVFVVWFISGIGIMYSKGMPSLTPQLRLERLVPIDLSSVNLTVAEAAQKAELDPTGRVTFLTIMDRPAYRFGNGPTTVFADNGEILEDIGQADALKVAARFTGLPEEKFQYSQQTETNQWTIGQVRDFPIHKINVDDGAGTELYISPQSAEVVLLTTRGSRALAWVAAIPHWFYFKSLRANGPLWRQVVIWSAGIGCILALAGILLAFTQLKITRPFRFSKISSYIPYSGWMRWHYITGFIFGILTFTWVFSGMLSMEPWGWASEGGLSDEVRDTLSGGDVDLASFPAMVPSAWQQLFPDGGLKEVSYARIQGDFYFVVRTTAPERALVAANPLQIRQEPFSTESIMTRVKETYPDVPILESEVITEYDSYYRSQTGAAPLPALRVKFGDPDATWFYFDTKMSQLVTGYHRLDRVERWIYNGFHSLDFSFWYYNRVVWQVVIIVFSLGCLASSGIGLYLGFKRVLRALKLA